MKQVGTFPCWCSQVRTAKLKHAPLQDFWACFGVRSHFQLVFQLADLPWGICSSPTMMEADGNGTISPEEWQRAGKNLEDMPLRFQDFEQCPQSAQEANTVTTP